MPLISALRRQRQRGRGAEGQKKDRERERQRRRGVQRGAERGREGQRGVERGRKGQRGRGRWNSVSLRPAWSTERLPRHSGLHKEALSQEGKKKGISDNVFISTLPVSGLSLEDT
jgi:hypothetical protein